MRLLHVLESREPDGELLASVGLTSLYLFGALYAEAAYPMSPAPISVFSERFDLMLPPIVGESILECATAFGWTTELDANGYQRGHDEISSQYEMTSPSCMGRSPVELWRERGPGGGERWMTLQRLTANRAAALELLRIAARANHFPTDVARVMEAYTGWLTCCGGFQLAVVRQWEDPLVTCDEPAEQRLLNDCS